MPGILRSLAHPRRDDAYELKISRNRQTIIVQGYLSFIFNDNVMSVDLADELGFNVNYNDNFIEAYVCLHYTDFAGSSFYTPSFYLKFKIATVGDGGESALEETAHYRDMWYFHIRNDTLPQWITTRLSPSHSYCNIISENETED
ncbi:MAG: hypothetical protein U0798_01255 [Gemmataceae bacterium]